MLTKDSTEPGGRSKTSSEYSVSIYTRVTEPEPAHYSDASSEFQFFMTTGYSEPWPGAPSETSTVYSYPAYTSTINSQRTLIASSSASDIEKFLDDAFQPTNDSLEDFLRLELREVELNPYGVGVKPGANPLMDPSSFPDGGKQAWLCVLGGMCSLFVSFGWINAIGVFQEYYQTHSLSHYTSQQIAWIPSLEGFMMFFGGLWVGRAYDNYGPRWILLFGTFFHVFGLMMASLSTEYYQFILTQGIISPFGASMIFYPSMNAVVSWFFKKRGLALGVAASGSSLGGVIFPIMVQKLIPEVGFGWTMRICAFLILGLMVIANLTIVSRIPPHPKPVKLVDFVKPFTELPFVLLSLGSFFTFLGLFLPFTFIILEGQGRGVPNNIAIYLVSILNATSIVGRILPAYLADKVGRFTVFLTMSLLSAAVTLALWLPTSGTAAVVAYSCIFGFISGCIVSLAPTLVAQISDVRQIGVRTGLMFSVVAIAVLFGSPIGGQLISADGNKYQTMQLFSGVMMAAGAFMYLWLRIKVGGWSISKKI